MTIGRRVRAGFFLLTAGASAVVLAVGCERAQPAAPPVDDVDSSSKALIHTTSAVATDVAQVVLAYESLQKMTPEPVRVWNATSQLCFAPTKDETADVASDDDVFGPHADSMVDIYMNDIAADSFPASVSPYREGAVIVKKKTRVDEGRVRGNGVGGMVKRAAGSLPDSGDWEYFYLDEKSGELSSNVESCATCHNNTPETDHVFGTPQRYGIAQEGPLRGLSGSLPKTRKAVHEERNLTNGPHSGPYRKTKD